jgi:ubiquinone/menaquinone biosynthesis C-methylase UbiE
MGNLVNITTVLHESSVREYLPRMVDDKANCMIIAKQYEKDYWDGDRRYGYGGYSYMPGRWKPVAEALIQKYRLTNKSSVLDVGCGKGYLLYEMKLLLPGLRVVGFDISNHALENAHKDIKDSLFIHRAQDPFPFNDNEFDLVISLGCFHNLRVFELEQALTETERVGRHGYVMLESYRNELEQFNLQCWALTCETFFDHEEWPWIYEKFGYSGDYEFIYFT